MPRVSEWKRQQLRRKADQERRKERLNQARDVNAALMKRAPAIERERPQAIELDRSRRWYIARTLPREEANARDELQASGVDVYMPEDVRTTVRRGRRVEVRIPVLNQYLCVGLGPRRPQFSAVRSADGVVEILGVDGEPMPVPVDDLQAFENFLTEKLASEGGSAGFAVGDNVRISEGVFAAFQGIIDKVTATHARVLLTMFGRKTPTMQPLEALSAA
jgi:transcription antitermination factor NusG